MKYVTTSTNYQCNFCLAQTNEEQMMKDHLRIWHSRKIRALEEYDLLVRRRERKKQ
jgi:hypothetical protein